MDDLLLKSIEELKLEYLTLRTKCLDYGISKLYFDTECACQLLKNKEATPVLWVKAARYVHEKYQIMYEEELAAEQAKEDADQLKYEEYIERKYNMSKEG